MVIKPNSKHFVVRSSLNGKILKVMREKKMRIPTKNYNHIDATLSSSSSSTTLDTTKYWTKELKGNSFESLILHTMKLSLKFEGRVKHFHIYKSSKSLLLMDFFS